MLTKLTVKNLKCFNDTAEIPLSSLNLIYGENSSGKSSIMLALQMLSHYLLEYMPANQKEYPFKGIVYNHDKNREIIINLRITHDYIWGGGRVEDSITNYDFSSTLAWSEDHQKTKFQNLKIKQVLAEFWENMAETWDFYSQDDDLVAPINIYSYRDSEYDSDLSFIVALDYLQILEGIEKQIEVDIMNDFYDNNGEENDLIGYNHVARDSSKKPEQEKAEKDLKEWRKGLPDWIKECPPSWKTYRKSKEFTKNVEMLRTTKFKEIIGFYEGVKEAWGNKPKNIFTGELKVFTDFIKSLSKKYIESNPATIKLCQGDLSNIEYNTSQIFVKDAIGLLDSELVLDNQEWCAKLNLISQSEKAQKVLKLRNSIDRMLLTDFKEAASHIQKTLRKIVVVAPLRHRAERIYSSVSISPDLKTSGIDGSTIPLMLKKDEKLLERVNEWLGRLGVDYTIEIHELDDEYFKLLLRDTRNHDAPLVQYADVGFGISQILPIVVACLNSRPSIILIEQPELHIHPRLQAELGSLFVEAKNTYKHQLIIETHSEHLMLRIQRLIRKKETYPCSVNVLYVSRGSSGSSVQKLELNENGDFLDAWPNGFFPERLKELL